MLLHPPATSSYNYSWKRFLHQLQAPEVGGTWQIATAPCFHISPPSTFKDFYTKKLSPKHFVAVLFIITEYLKLQTKQKPPPIDVNAIGLMARLTRPPLEVLVTRRQPMPLVGGGLLGWNISTFSFFSHLFLQFKRGCNPSFLTWQRSGKSSRDNRREFCQWSDTAARLMTSLSFVTCDLSRVFMWIVKRDILSHVRDIILYYLAVVVVSPCSSCVRTCIMWYLTCDLWHIIFDSCDIWITTILIHD